MLNELPITILSSSLTTLWIMAVTRLRTTVASAAVMVLVNFAYVTAGESLGIAYSCYFASSAGLGVTLMNSTVGCLVFFCLCEQKMRCVSLDVACSLTNSSFPSFSFVHVDCLVIIPCRIPNRQTTTHPPNRQLRIRLSLRIHIYRPRKVPRSPSKHTRRHHLLRTHLFIITTIFQRRCCPLVPGMG